MCVDTSVRDHDMYELVDACLGKSKVWGHVIVQGELELVLLTRWAIRLGRLELCTCEDVLM